MNSADLPQSLLIVSQKLEFFWVMMMSIFTEQRSHPPSQIDASVGGGCYEGVGHQVCHLGPHFHWIVVEEVSIASVITSVKPSHTPRRHRLPCMSHIHCGGDISLSIEACHHPVVGWVVCRTPQLPSRQGSDVVRWSTVVIMRDSCNHFTWPQKSVKRTTQAVGVGTVPVVMMRAVLSRGETVIVWPRPGFWWCQWQN